MNPERIEEALRTADYVRLDPDARARALNVVAAALREAQERLADAQEKGWQRERILEAKLAAHHPGHTPVACPTCMAVSPPADEAKH